MWFLIKSAFWLSLVLLVIPFNTGSSDPEAPSVGPIEAFFAAREAVGDLGGICERKPDVCETGRAAMQTVMVRAREISRIAFDMMEPSETARAETQAGDAIADAIAASDPATTGSVPAAPSN